MKRAIFVLALAALVLQVPAVATTADTDLGARVPALSAFHEVVSPRWHDAWPKKDVGAFVAFTPKVNSGLEAIARTELPSFLRDYATTWAAAVFRLKTIAGECGADWRFPRGGTEVRRERCGVCRPSPSLSG